MIIHKIISLYSNKKLCLLMIFLFSIITQTIFLCILIQTTHQINQSSDYTKFYEPVAENILNGRGIVERGGNLAIRRPPGYPIILSTIFGLADFLGLDRVTLIIVFNIITTAVCCIIIFLIAESIFNRRIALMASLIWITYPFNLWIIKQPNSEVPFLLFLYLGFLGFLLFIKKRYSIFTLISGILFGISALIRPTSVLIGFLCAVVLLFYTEFPKMKRIYSAILLICGFLFTILPWEIKILSSIGHLIFISAGGPPSIRDGLTFAVTPGEGGDQINVPEDVMALMKRIRANRTELRTTANILKFLQQEIRDNPWPVLKLLGLKVCRSWYGTDEMWYEKYTRIIQIFYITLGFIGIILCIRIYKERLRFICLLLIMIVYFWGMTTLVLSILRYMIPAMGFIIIFSAITADYLLIRWRQMRN